MICNNFCYLWISYGVTNSQINFIKLYQFRVYSFTFLCKFWYFSVDLFSWVRYFAWNHRGILQLNFPIGYSGTSLILFCSLHQTTHNLFSIWVSQTRIVIKRLSLSQNLASDRDFIQSALPVIKPWHPSSGLNDMSRKVGSGFCGRVVMWESHMEKLMSSLRFTGLFIVVSWCHVELNSGIFPNIKENISTSCKPVSWQIRLSFCQAGIWVLVLN